MIRLVGCRDNFVKKFKLKVKTNPGILTVTILASSFMMNAQNKTPENLNLSQLKQKVAIHSKEIKIAEYQLENKLYHVQDAKNAQLPNLNITASVDKASNFLIYDQGLFNHPSKHEVIHTLYATNTNMYLSLYEGLRLKNTVKLKQIEADLSKELLLEKEAAVQLNAILLFLDLYLQNEWELLMKADIKEKEHQLSEIKNFHELGVVLQSDVLRAELELSKRKMTLIEIENQQLVVNQKLNVLIGNPDDQLVQPEVEIKYLPKYENFDEALNEGKHKAYAEKISHWHVEEAEKNLDLIKANNSIKVGLTGSFQFSNPQIFLYPYNDSWYNLGLIGVKASYSFSELYKNKNKKAAAKIATEEAHKHHEKISDDVRTKIYQDYLALDESEKYVTIYKLNETYAVENARILKDAYFNQTSLITDLLDADVLVLKSKFELKQAQINVFKNYYKLQYSKGTL